MTVADAIARMQAIVGSLPHSDGVARFAELYREVTVAVGGGLEESAFADPRFLERLDVVFADLFFAAVDADARDPTTAPAAWRPLFQARSARGIAPIQFVFAGMNAHINRDLPVALVATCSELGIEPRTGSPQHEDFLHINALLAEAEARLKKETLLTGVLAAIDRLLKRFNRLGDIVAMWNVERARDAAWTNAETLWMLRDAPQLSAEYLASLDRLVGFAGRGLLVPSDSFLQRTGRRLRGA